VTAADEPPTPARGPSTDAPSGPVRARTILRLRPIWAVPVTITSVLIVLMAFTYIGSVVNPTGHLRGLPVLIVDEDAGTNTPGGRVDFGSNLVEQITHNPTISARLRLRVEPLSGAERDLDRGADFAALVIPPTFTRSLIQLTGHQVGAATALPSLQLLSNVRLGSLGVSLASGVLTPAVAAASHQLAGQLVAQATAAARADPTSAAVLADPLRLASAPYRPLPAHTALGLSAFYIALLSIMCGFLGATVINSSVDAALGYGATEIGPNYRQRRPLSIDRRETLLIKWAMAGVVSPLLTALLVAVGVGILGMDAPHVAALWLFVSLAAITVATGTLALYAALGSLGQLVAMIFFIYLALASSGGTVPIQALPGFFRAVGQIEPLRLIVTGCRSILYFGARADAGLSHSIIVIAFELGAWLLIGLAVTTWYDRRKLYRLAPEVIAFVERAVEAQRSG